MMAERNEQSDASDREIVTTRVIDAPRALVFEAFSRPDHLGKWWGPRGFTTTTTAFDFRVGGAWVFTMHGPDGKDWPNRVAYEEIVTDERIAFAHYGEGDAPAFHTTITLVGEGDKTRVTMRGVFPTAAARALVVKEHKAIEGARETLERLADLAPTMNAFDVGRTRFTRADRELTVKRTFDAPRPLVFEAWTKPEHLARWWGPKGFTTPTCEVDLRVGGKFLFVMRSPEGEDFPYQGTFLEISVPTRLVQRGSIHDGNDVTTTIAFEERGAKTDVTIHQRYTMESPATRGATEGWSTSLERLDDVLRS